MNLDHVHFWAKTLPDGQPGISVRNHCLNVGCVGEALIATKPANIAALLKPALSLVAGHDVGKISPDFLMQCGSLARQPVASGDGGTVQGSSALGASCRGAPRTHHS